jgi:hypothetical protein
MFTLLGSLLGFITSIGPGIFNKIMDMKQDAADKAHELTLNAQISADKRDEAVIRGAGNQNVAIQKTVQTTLANASPWVVDLSGTVRPFITYAFFFEFFLLSLAVAFGALTEDQFKAIWSAEMSGIFATIMSHWFGNKLVSKWTK